MAYRAGPAHVPPRVLVVRPQRADASLLFMLLGGGGVCVALFMTQQSVYEHGFGANVVVPLIGAALGLIFAMAGVYFWFVRVELSLWQDGNLTMRWTHWPSEPRLQSLPLSEITNVVIEGGGENSRIVVVTKSGPLPLTDSYTSDNLTAKVAEMKAFLGLQPNDRAKARRR